MPDTKEYSKQYYEAHKDEFAQRSKKRTETKFECECGGRYSMSSKANHIKQKKHLYFLEHGEQKPKADSLTTCECGLSFKRNALFQHLKTKKHQLRMSVLRT